MKIGLLGYGKMGKEVEKKILQKGYSVAFTIHSKNTQDLNSYTLQKSDVVIEFSNPEVAFQNIKFCIENQTPVVCGTTGWLDKMNDITKLCKIHNSTFLHSPNFSIGMNLFFEINNYISKLMANKNYDILIEEIHHNMKKDRPSGTAIKISNDIDEIRLNKKEKTPIVSKRIGDIKGEHTVKYISEFDDIYISHKAKNRQGFASGALLAAEFIQNKKGIFTMADVINNI